MRINTTEEKKYKVINYYIVDGKKIQTTRKTNNRELSFSWFEDGYKAKWIRGSIIRVRNKKGEVNLK